ncbi:MAG TPA: hypothetical protein VGR85_05360 [Candidatus Limnocylindria bacterium]|nr:hypothetical protein [Candidatus Limnocylindria bacterium]
MNALFTSTGFLRYGGIVLLLVGVVGVLGVFNSFAFFSLDTGENIAHLGLGVVGVGAGFGLKNAGIHRLLTIVVFATAVLFTLWGLILPDGGALANGAFAKPNFYGLANLENPADSILHLVVAAWAGAALWMERRAPATAPAAATR